MVLPMQEQRTLSPAEEDARDDSAVLGLLLDPESERPWSVDEVTRELGRDPADSLVRLHGAGLVHRMDGFVWASRAALAADELSV
jgi:hypothetical protein